MKIRVHKILKHTKVEGPGTRYCIWFQGCSRHCPGCWAQATWPHNSGQEFDVEEILKDILTTPNIEGVTFLGGEPFEQPRALELLAKEVHAAGLSTLCFTGGKIEEIKNNPNFVNYFNKTKNIMEMAFIMKNSSQVICVDSAPLHVAIGVNANTIAIFGPTNELKLVPQRENVKIITNNTNCRPCLWHKRTFNCNKSKCLNINHQLILDKIN